MASESDSVITLYDSASDVGKPLGWNPCILKIRYALNFKKLPYKIVGLEYPEIEPTLRKLGVEPTDNKPDGAPLYTLPVIVDPARRTSSGVPTAFSESWLIAEYLDTTYPNRPLLFPKGTKALQRLFHDHFWKTIFWAVVPILVPKAYDILGEASRPYWRESREWFMGEKLEDMCPKGTQKCEERWSAVQNSFTGIAKLLAENGKIPDPGPFVMANQVSYGDFTILAILESMFVLMPEDWDQRVKHWDGGRWEKLRSSCAALEYMN